MVRAVSAQELLHAEVQDPSHFARTFFRNFLRLNGCKLLVYGRIRPAELHGKAHLLAFSFAFALAVRREFQSELLLLKVS